MYYVYKTTNTVNDKIYIGVHKSDNIQSDQYLGSGDQLRLSIAKYGRQKFNRQILYQFGTKEEAYAMEKLIVDKQFVKRKDTYNIRLGGQGGFGHIQGSICVKDKQGNIFRVDKNDSRYLSGQLVGITKGFFTGKDKDGNIKQTSVFDPRYISGEIVGIGNMKDKIVVKDSDNNTFFINKDDPRFLSGQLVGITKGKILVKDQFGNHMYVESDDPRWLSGQLVGINRGIKFSYGHQLGQKNSQYGTMWITNGVQNKKIKKCDTLPEGWYRGRIVK